MNKIAGIFILIFLIKVSLTAQVETIPAEHTVYSYLKKMQVQGYLSDYDDIVLPLSRKEVVNHIKKLLPLKNQLNKVDKEYIERFVSNFSKDFDGEVISLIDNFPDIFKSFFGDAEKQFYYYQDSTLTFYFSPYYTSEFISNYKNETLKHSFINNIGGRFGGSYDNWFGFFLQGSNGFVIGDRVTSRINQDVNQSFTFNDTEMNYFDDTKGYARFSKGIMSLQIGRERILWGAGFKNKLIFDYNPPLFDFVRVDLSYKSLRYNFLHGWLAQPMSYYFVDSLKGYTRITSAKFVAVSRLGFNLTEKSSIGLTQSVIYANRPIQLAYLNPFLFWESAQRSLNDVDNSFIGIDFRSIPLNGLSVNATLIFDDIDYSNFLKGKWNSISNRYVAQMGFFLTEPLFFHNTTFNLEFIKIRPFMYSHVGIGESLTYTNNSYMLGTDISPNSGKISVDISHFFTENIKIDLGYSLIFHGANELDENGNIINNYGGDVFTPNFVGQFEDVYFLDGIKEKKQELYLIFHYEPASTFSLWGMGQFIFEKIKDEIKRSSNFRVGLRIFPY